MNVSTLSVPVGRWVRLEARIVSSATVGSSVVKIFTEADSPYPAETMTSASSFNTAPNGTGIKVGRFGIVGSSVATYNYYLDDITMTDVGYPGPANPTQAPPLEWCSNADFGTNGTLLTAGNSGDASNRFFQTFSQTGKLVSRMHMPLMVDFPINSRQ